MFSFVLRNVYKHFLLKRHYINFSPGMNVEGTYVEVVLAKPVDKTDYVRYTRFATRGTLSQVSSRP